MLSTVALEELSRPLFFNKIERREPLLGSVPVEKGVAGRSSEKEERPGSPNKRDWRHDCRKVPTISTLDVVTVRWLAQIKVPTHNHPALPPLPLVPRLLLGPPPSSAHTPKARRQNTRSPSESPGTLSHLRGGFESEGRCPRGALLRGRVTPKATIVYPGLRHRYSPLRDRCPPCAFQFSYIRPCIAARTPSLVSHALYPLAALLFPLSPPPSFDLVQSIR